MEVKDIHPNMGNIDLVLEVVTKEESRTFEKFGKKGKVCNSLVQDATGKISLTLWNEDIEKVKVGDKIHLQNGWCSEFRGEKQLSAGKFGKIEIVESGPPTVFTNDPQMISPSVTEDDSSEEEEGEGGEHIDEEFVE